MKIANLFLAVVLLVSTNSFSQDKKKPITDGAMIYPEIESGKLSNHVSESSEIISLREKVSQARNSGNADEAEKYASELFQKNGARTSTGEIVPISNIKYGEQISDNPPNVTSISRVSDVNMIFNVFATVTEQIGPTKGRIWTIY